MRQYWLAKKDNKNDALYPDAANGNVEFKIAGDGCRKKIPKNFDPKKGTVARAAATCLICGATIEANNTRKLFQDGKAGQRLIAVVLHNPKKRGKHYRIDNDENLKIFKKAENYLKKKREKLMSEWGIDPVPDEPIKRVPVSFGVINVWVYGMNTWGDLFNSRQKLALITFVDKVRRAHEMMLKDGYEEEYAKAVVSYLSLIVSRIPDTNFTICRWDGSWEKTSTTFARQALPMNWDYIEANIIGEKGCSWQNILKSLLAVFHNITIKSISSVDLSHSLATLLPHLDDYFDAVFTDPPYYDNVPYSYLSDFFYVWLKRSVGHIHPDLFSTPLTPKKNEIVAYSHGPKGYEGGIKFFEEMLKKSFQEIHRVLKPDGIAIIVYAHKSTAGWETLINSLLDSGLVMTGARPINTEMKKRLRANESAALASSIYIIARKMKRESTAFYNDVKNELKNYLDKKLEHLWEQGISGGDFFIAAIGSAIEVFGKYEKVMDLYASGWKLATS